MKSDKKMVCPHCGRETEPVADAWMGIMSDAESVCCSNCKKTISRPEMPVVAESDPVESRGFNFKFFAISFLLLAALILLNKIFGVLRVKDDFWQIVYEVVFVLFASSCLAYGRTGRKIKYLAIWGGIFLALMTGYSYRHELAGMKDKVLAEFIPAKGYQQTLNAISFPISSNGHFYIRAAVNGVPVTFLVDTGASQIVLSPEDARKVGIEVKDLHFDQQYETANGIGRGSSIHIADFSVGDIHLRDIRASVNEADMRDSLLGMTFFKRLKRYDVRNDVLTLYWDAN